MSSRMRGSFSTTRTVRQWRAALGLIPRATGRAGKCSEMKVRNVQSANGFRCARGSALARPTRNHSSRARARPSAVRLTQQGHDAGDKLGFLKATVEFALKRDDLGPAFRAWLKSFPI